MNNDNPNKVKQAKPDYVINELLEKRWSPYAFDPRPISKEDLQSIFEAARWAASSFNEQPWRYIIATRDNTEEFEKMLSCLMEANQSWAKNCSVVGLGVVKMTFTQNDKPNRVAIHDLGLASGNLTVEATSRGLYVHQMGGIFPDKAREVYGIPDDFEAVTGIAVGYLSEDENSLEELKKRDLSPRERRPISETIFTGQWDGQSL